MSLRPRPTHAIWSAFVLALTSPLSAQQATSPHGALPEDLSCVDCHTSTAWVPLRSDLAFDHSESTAFVLNGAHETVDCAACHSELRFDEPQASVQDCGSCHFDVHLDSFAQPCSSCHTVESFSELPPGVVHPADFALEGAHLQITCESCHVDDLGGAFTPLDRDCLTCHLDDYDATMLVNHAALGFPTDCTACHTVLDWRDVASFDHVEFSAGYQLLGVHEQIECSACHSLPGGGIPSPPAGQDDCIGCHLADYNEEHAGSGFPTTCLNCHDLFDWDSAEDVLHATISNGFTLEGRHSGLACALCHTPTGQTLFVASSPRDCVACHVADWQREHATQGYPTECEMCHTVENWDADFNHAALADGFDLLGGHEGIECEACHTSDLQSTLFPVAGPDDCVACHQADYDVEHADSGFPNTCVDCHSVATWSDATTDHSALSGGYTLDGAHEPLGCPSCHVGTDLTLIWAPADQDDCVACHQADYDTEHTNTGFPVTCLTCHTQATWADATVDHATIGNGFVLVGDHDLLDCSACHVGVAFESLFTPSTPEDCASCHQGDFTTEHAGFGYPQDCLLCHALTTWTGAVFDHDGDYFPISAGAHSEVWDTCATCHTVPEDYAVFTCIDCHDHAQAQTDDDHKEVVDYSYDNAGCFSCHPDGKS